MDYKLLIIFKRTRSTCRMCVFVSLSSVQRLAGRDWYLHNGRDGEPCTAVDHEARRAACSRTVPRLDTSAQLPNQPINQLINQSIIVVLVCMGKNTCVRQVSSNFGLLRMHVCARARACIRTRSVEGENSGRFHAQAGGVKGLEHGLHRGSAACGAHIWQRREHEGMLLGVDAEVPVPQIPPQPARKPLGDSVSQQGQVISGVSHAGMYA